MIDFADLFKNQGGSAFTKENLQKGGGL